MTYNANKVTMIQFRKRKRKKKEMASKLSLTDSSKPINPTWDWISSESNTSIIAKMVAVFGNQIICIPSILPSQLLHYSPHLLWSQIRFSNENCLPKCKSITLFWFSLKYPSCWIFMSSKCILNAMNWIYPKWN